MNDFVIENVIYNGRHVTTVSSKDCQVKVRMATDVIWTHTYDSAEEASAALEAVKTTLFPPDPAAWPAFQTKEDQSVHQNR